MTSPVGLRRVPEAAATRPAAMTMGALAVAAALPAALLDDVIDGRAAAMTGFAVATAAGLATLAYTALARRTRTLARLGIAVAAAVAGAAVVAGVVAATWPGADTRRPPVAALDATIHGWAALATSPVPAPPEPRLLVPIALVTWAAALGGWAIAWRGSARLLAMCPAAAGLALATVAAGAHPWRPVACGAAFVGAAGVVLIGTRPRRPARIGAMARWAVLVGSAAALAAFVGPALALGRDDDPFDPRQHLATPLVPAAVETPLDNVSRWLQDDTPLFTVRASEPLTTRLLALDTFDGVTWTVSGQWLPVAAASDAAPELTVAAREVRAEFELAGLDGPWLPSFGIAPEVDGVAAIVHPSSGSVARRDGTPPDRAYSVTGDIPLPDPEALQLRAAAFDPEARRALAVPAQPPALLVEMARTATEGASTPFLKAFFLQRYLRGFALDPEVRGGHSYGHLEHALTVTGVGTSEQFATAFAILGRLVDLPTRVVVGFAPGDSDGSGAYAVGSADVVVWPEVKFEGFGWVPFDPTPAQVGGAADLMEIGDQSVQLVNPPATVPPAAPEPAQPVAPAADAGATGIPTVLIGLAAGALVVVLSVAGTVVVLKRRRTRARRRRADARARTVGAWHDVLDRLTEAGAPAAHGSTIEEYVDAPDHTQLLWGLYRPVTKALYGDAAVTDADANEAWHSRDRLVAHLRSRDGLRGRARRACDPRTLRGATDRSTSGSATGASARRR